MGPPPLVHRSSRAPVAADVATGMGKTFHPVVDTRTGRIDDLCTPTMHNCSWTMMPSKGGQPCKDLPLRSSFGNPHQ